MVSDSVLWSYISRELDLTPFSSLAAINSIPNECYTGGSECFTKASELKGKKFHLIVSYGILNGFFSLKEPFKDLYDSLDGNGCLVMAEPVVSFDDAWMNTLLSTVNKEHKRDFRPEEIINAGIESGFDLRQFKKDYKDYPILVSKENNDKVAGQLQNTPEKCKRLIVEGLNNGKLLVERGYAFFIFNKI